MAWCAVGKRLSSKEDWVGRPPPSRCFVALGAVNRRMLAHKRKFRLTMIESTCRRPRVHPVTRLTLCAHGAPMTICVARNASLIETEERLVGVIRESFLYFRALNICIGMTLFALQRGMFAGEWKSAFCMIELGLFELRHPCVSPQVLFVARYAGARRIQVMKTALRIVQCPYLSMARQALRTAKFLAALMALRAVRNPLKVLMSLRELTGRDLSTGQL